MVFLTKLNISEASVGLALGEAKVSYSFNLSDIFSNLFIYYVYCIHLSDVPVSVCPRNKKQHNLIKYFLHGSKYQTKNVLTALQLSSSVHKIAMKSAGRIYIPRTSKGEQTETNKV